MRLLTSVALLILVAGCSGDSSDPTGQRGFTVEGFVYYQGTRIPIDGVRVSIGEAAATTTAQGRFRIDGVAPGAHSITAEKTGYDLLEQSLDVSGDLLTTLEMTSVDFTVTVSGQVSGDIPGNLPVAAATLRIVNPDGTDSGLSAVSDEDGLYSLPTVPVGRRTISAQAASYVPTATEVDVTGPAFSYSLTMSPATGLTLPATISDQETLHAYHSPYFVAAAGLQVESGAGLTIEAGVEVGCAAGAAIVLDIGSAFDVQGSAESPVSVAAATDGSEWNGLLVRGSATISHLRIDKAAEGLHLVVGPSPPTIADVAVSGCGTGLRVSVAEDVVGVLEIVDTTVSECTVGLRLEPAASLGVTLEGCRMTDCDQNGLEIVSGDVTLDATACVFANNGENGIYCGFGPVDLVCTLSAVNIEHNGNNALQVDGIGGAVITIRMSDSNVTGNGGAAVDLFRQCTKAAPSARSNTDLDARGNWWGQAPPDPDDFATGRSSAGGGCLLPVVDYSAWASARIDNGADHLER